MFSQQHYKVIAKKIWGIIPETWRSANLADVDRPLISRNLLINDLCDLFRADNPRFDEAKFRHACDQQEVEK